MTAMRPAPKPASSQEVEEPVLDDIIQRIDQSLPIIHKQVADSESETPTTRLSREQAIRAQAVFQDMRDNPILNEEGDDICLKKKKKKKRVRRVNGHLG